MSRGVGLTKINGIEASKVLNIVAEVGIDQRRAQRLGMALVPSA